MFAHENDFLLVFFLFSFALRPRHWIVWPFIFLLRESEPHNIACMCTSINGKTFALTVNHEGKVLLSPMAALQP